MYGYVVEALLVIVLLTVFLNIIATIVKDILAKQNNKSFKATSITKLLAKWHRKFEKGAFIDEDTIEYGLKSTGFVTSGLIGLSLAWPYWYTVYLDLRPLLR
jgi:hypothetical protein